MFSLNTRILYFKIISGILLWLHAKYENIYFLQVSGQYNAVMLSQNHLYLCPKPGKGENISGQIQAPQMSSSYSIVFISLCHSWLWHRPVFICRLYFMICTMYCVLNFERERFKMKLFGNCADSLELYKVYNATLSKSHGLVKIVIQQ